MRRLLLVLLALGALVAVGAAALLALRSEPPAPSRDARGPVLLVPGYGGSTSDLEPLAGALRELGREAVVVELPGDGRGDLRTSAQALAAAAARALGAGAPSVDVVGYSAGGVVARLWAEEHGQDARRVVTLGSPHHGSEVAAVAVLLAPGRCPLGCQQLAPGSELLTGLEETPDGPDWLSLWTTQDETVTPSESARLDGAVNLALQDLCPGLQLDHAALPTAPVVRALVVQALSAAPLDAPTSCPTS